MTTPDAEDVEAVKSALADEWARDKGANYDEFLRAFAARAIATLIARGWRKT